MIIGIGIDLIEVERVKKACEKEAFLTRSFTSEERLCFESHPERAAGNFAVKEAVSKVMGTGFRGMSLNEIEVLRDDLGKPYIRLYGRALERAQRLGIERWHVSISNTKTLATAYVIGEGVSV
jgi:holo-[acyl-carrier protein] synthase